MLESRPDIYPAIRSGKTPPVKLTPASSLPSPPIGSIPFPFTYPRSINRLTATESWPEASITSLLSIATGSTHVMFLGNADTGIQFTTTPPTRLFLSTRSSNFVNCRNRTPASQAALIDLLHAFGPHVAESPSLIFLY